MATLSKTGPTTRFTAVTAGKEVDNHYGNS